MVREAYKCDKCNNVFEDFAYFEYWQNGDEYSRGEHCVDKLCPECGCEDYDEGFVCDMCGSFEHEVYGDSGVCRSCIGEYLDRDGFLDLCLWDSDRHEGDKVSLLEDVVFYILLGRIEPPKVSSFELKTCCYKLLVEKTKYDFDEIIDRFMEDMTDCFDTVAEWINEKLNKKEQKDNDKN